MENPNSKQINEKENSNLEEKVIPEYFNLYPKEENYNLDTKVPFITWDFNKQRKLSNTSEEDNIEDTYEMNEHFLESLLQRKTQYNKIKTINTICNFIRNSKLIQKLESDQTSEKKMDMAIMVYNCAKSLSYVKLSKGEILFKIGDIGDKFFFILKGKINILKLRELKEVYMTNVEYLQYCIFLIQKKEDYILKEVLKKNKEILDISNPEDIIKLYRIVFIKILRDKIANHSITTNAQLFTFFSEYKQDISNFRISKTDLTALEEKIKKGDFGSVSDWQNYILKRVRPNIKESIFYEFYEKAFKNIKEENNIICYVYESFLFLGPGLFFGDFALDYENARRNATIMALEKTYLGWMKSIDYANMIAPKRKIEKYNEIMFLYKNYFFKKINVFTFEKKFFHLFPPREFSKGDLIISQNDKADKLFFIKTGQIDLEIKVSVFELQDIIEKIYDQLIKNEYYQDVVREKGINYLLNINDIKNIKENLKEPILEKARQKESRFLDELNKKIKYKLTIITQNELIGIEEIFLGIENICSGRVISDKFICYELSEKQVDIFLGEEKSLILPYTKTAVNKIMALLDRLMNLKRNRIFINQSKYEDINDNIQEEKNKFTIDKNKINENEKNNENNKDNENKKDEIIDTENKTNLINNEKLANQKKKEFGNLYPLSDKAKFNLKKILSERNVNKNRTKRDKVLFSYFRNKKKENTKQIQKNIFQKKNFSFFKEEDSKTLNNSNLGIMKYIIPEIKNKKNNSLLLGNTCIEVNKIKKEINEYNFYMNKKILNNYKYKSSHLSRDSFSQIFELSKLRYPIIDRSETYNNRYNNNNTKSTNNNINNNNNISNNNNNIIINNNYYYNDNYNTNTNSINNNKTSSNFNDNLITQEIVKNKSDLINIEKDYFYKKMTNSKSHKFYPEKVKKITRGDNTIITKSFTFSNKKINLANQNLESTSINSNKKIITKRELLSEIIKEFDKKMKKQILNSYKHKKNKSNSKNLIENKKDKENNSSNKNSILPKIKLRLKNKSV